jgi:hypothetical protein
MLITVVMAQVVEPAFLAPIDYYELLASLLGQYPGGHGLVISPIG